VALLLAHGADVHATATQARWGVLHFAAAVRDDDDGAIEAIARLLLDAGADASLAAADGASAAQVAEMTGSAAALRALGAGA
jgi:ankyrin repeat protein